MGYYVRMITYMLCSRFFDWVKVSTLWFFYKLVGHFLSN